MTPLILFLDIELPALLEAVPLGHMALVLGVLLGGMCPPQMVNKQCHTWSTLIFTCHTHNLSHMLYGSKVRLLSLSNSKNESLMCSSGYFAATSWYMHANLLKYVLPLLLHYTPPLAGQSHASCHGCSNRTASLASTPTTVHNLHKVGKLTVNTESHTPVIFQPYLQYCIVYGFSGFHQWC